MLMWTLCVGLALVSSSSAALAASETTGDTPPEIGQPLVLNGIRVTLLSVERLAERDRKTPHGAAPDGLRIVWFLENRPGAPLAPVLGDVRVFFGSRQYNRVTNATSRRPFAPDMIIHDQGRFFAGPGKTLQRLVPTPRPGAVSALLEVYVRGDVIPSDADGVAEIQLGDSEAASAGATVRYDWFRFRLPRR